MAKKISYYRNKADKAMQQSLTAKNPLCEVCGRQTNCMHHFFTKSSSSFLRYDERNLIPLCQRCHFRHHNTSDPTIHATIIEKRGLDWYNELRRESHTITKATKSYYNSIIEKYD